MRLFMTHEEVTAGVATRPPKQHREHKTAQRFGGVSGVDLLILRNAISRRCSWKTDR
jgi:hypothetical protein